MTPLFSFLPAVFQTQLISRLMTTNQAPLRKAAPMKGRNMLQRYDISMDDDTNRLSIKEFAVIEQKPQKSEYYNMRLENFSLIHEVSYDVDIIRAAIEEGSDALISELRSDDFFPIGSCSKIIAEKVTGVFNGDAEPVSKIFFDDRTLLSTYNEE